MGNNYELEGGIPPAFATDQSDPYRNQIAKTDGVRLSGEAAKEIVAEGNKFRAAHPWIFRHQDAIGFSLFLFSIASLLVMSWLYLHGFVGATVTILSNAFWMSVLHELEHDLIHYMYFRKDWVLHNLMMLGIFIFRPNSSSGWIRRRLHLHHHRVSGTKSDLEEQAITNGCPWGIRRFIMTGDLIFSWFLRFRLMDQVSKDFLRAQPDLTTREQRRNRGIINTLSLFPVANLFYLSWHVFLVWLLIKGSCGLLGVSPSFLRDDRALQYDAAMHTLAVVMYVPSVLRLFCLQFVSSNIHYFGDVEPGNVIQQCQVWNSWIVFPMQLLCFNFGGTHAIHHFVARETFYVRQLTAWQMYPILKKYGVRFNDFQSMLRANRRNALPATAKQ